MTRKTDISVFTLVEYGKREGKINQGLVALWTGRLGHTAYLIFKQLKQLCESGALDDDEYVCVASKDEIHFRKVKKPTYATMGAEELAVFEAQPTEGEEGKNEVEWGSR